METSDSNYKLYLYSFFQNLSVVALCISYFSRVNQLPISRTLPIYSIYSCLCVTLFFNIVSLYNDSNAKYYRIRNGWLLCSLFFVYGFSLLKISKYYFIMVKQTIIKASISSKYGGAQPRKQNTPSLTRIQKYKRSVICKDKYELGSYLVMYFLNPYIIMGIYTVGVVLCGLIFLIFYYTTLPIFSEFKDIPAFNGWLLFCYFLIWSIFTLASGYFSSQFILDFQENCYTKEVIFTFTANLSVGIVTLFLYYFNSYHPNIFKQGHVDFIGGALTVLLALSEFICFPLFINYV